MLTNGTVLCDSKQIPILYHLTVYFVEKCLGLEKLKLDCEEIKLLFPSERPSSKEENSQPLEQQSDSDEENKALDPFADGVCQNLVDLDQSSGAISPSHTGL